MANVTNSVQKRFALVRLSKDIRELEQNPLPGIACAPLDSNLQEVHCSISATQGPFTGLTVHIALSFPDNYPQKPPRAALGTYIPHSNIIPGSRYGMNEGAATMCIDMLESVISARPYEGWSTAYSCTGILLQLQNFLFDSFVFDMSGRFKSALWDRVLEEGGQRRPAAEVREKLFRAQRECLNFYCAKCGFCGRNATNDTCLMIDGMNTNGAVVGGSGASASASSSSAPVNRVKCILPKVQGLPADFPIRVPGVLLPNFDEVCVYQLNGYDCERTVSKEDVEGDLLLKLMWTKYTLHIQESDEKETDPELRRGGPKPLTSKEANKTKFSLTAKSKKSQNRDFEIKLTYNPCSERAPTIKTNHAGGEGRILVKWFLNKVTQQLKEDGGSEVVASFLNTASFQNKFGCVIQVREGVGSDQEKCSRSKFVGPLGSGSLRDMKKVLVDETQVVSYGDAAKKGKKKDTNRNPNAGQNVFNIQWTLPDNLFGAVSPIWEQAQPEKSNYPTASNTVAAASSGYGGYDDFGYIAGCNCEMCLAAKNAATTKGKGKGKKGKETKPDTTFFTENCKYEGEDQLLMCEPAPMDAAEEAQVVSIENETTPKSGSGKEDESGTPEPEVKTQSGEDDGDGWTYVEKRGKSTDYIAKVMGAGWKEKFLARKRESMKTDWRYISRLHLRYNYEVDAEHEQDLHGALAAGNRVDRGESVVLGNLPSVLIDHIFSFLDLTSLNTMASVSRGMRQMADEYKTLSFDIPMLRCFHTKQSFVNDRWDDVVLYADAQKAAEREAALKQQLDARRNQPGGIQVNLGQTRAAAAEVDALDALAASDKDMTGSVLGVGIELSPSGMGSNYDLLCHYDLLSHDGFHQLNVRESVWRNRLDYWMPMAIDSAHFKYALPLFFEKIGMLCSKEIERKTKLGGTGKFASKKRPYASSLDELQKLGLARREEKHMLAANNGERTKRLYLEWVESLKSLKDADVEEDEMLPVPLTVFNANPEALSALAGKTTKAKSPSTPALSNKFSLLDDDESDDDVEEIDAQKEEVEEGILTPTTASASSFAVTPLSPVSLTPRFEAPQRDYSHRRNKSLTEFLDEISNFQQHRVYVKPSILEVEAASKRELPYDLVLDILEIMPKLMSSQLVNIMKGDTAASQKALEGYSGLHNQFLRLLKEFPIIRRVVEAKIRDFVSHQYYRGKTETPNLGEFLCLLSVSDEYDWEDVAEPLVSETMLRNVRWQIQAYPELDDTPEQLEAAGLGGVKGNKGKGKGKKGYGKSGSGSFGFGATAASGNGKGFMRGGAAGTSSLFDRISDEQMNGKLEKKFVSSFVGRRLVMFHVWFLNNVAKPRHQSQSQDGSWCRKASAAIERTYERTKGVPPQSMVNKLQVATKRMFNEVTNWQTWFRECQLQPLSERDMLALLDAAQAESLRLGYHGPSWNRGVEWAEV